MDVLERDNSVSVRLRSDPRMLAVVRAIVRAFGTLAGFDETRVAAITLAVDESCANIIRHAYGGRTDGEVELTCSLRECQGLSRLVVELRDQGRPTPREIVSTPCADKDPHEPGGLGLRLIHAVVDRVELARTADGGNVLVLSVDCPPASGDGA